jgi:uncharacterized OsmC-like protein
MADHFAWGDNTVTEEFPRDFAKGVKKFKGTDPAALIVLGVAACLLAVIFLVTFMR